MLDNPPPEVGLFDEVVAQVTQLLRRVPRLTAPGLLGCRLEHLSLCAAAEEVLLLMAEAVACVAFGMLPVEAMHAL